MRTRYAVMVAIVLGALMLGAGCDAAGESDPTPVRTFKITPASGSFATTTAAPAATAVSTSAASGNEIAIAAKNSNLKFDKESITAAAGTVTIVFDNQDSGIPHNIHVFEGSDAKGKSVGQTDLETGPVEQKLTLELTPGKYYYQCDAHPTTMKGTLTVT